jgi:F0F1-type ATP synthase membrane subunit b/b'
MVVRKSSFISKILFVSAIMSLVAESSTLAQFKIGGKVGEAFNNAKKDVNNFGGQAAKARDEAIKRANQAKTDAERDAVRLREEADNRANQAKMDAERDAVRLREEATKRANQAMEDLRNDFKREQARVMPQLRVMRPDEVNNAIQNSILQWANAQLNKQGASINPQTSEMDLSKTKIANQIRGWASNFSQGNERSSGLDQFVYNLQTRQMVIKLWARHRHSWGRSIYPGQGAAILYDVTQKAQLIMDFNRKSVDFEIDAGPLAPKISSRAAQLLSDGDIIGAAEAMSPGIAGRLLQREVKNDYDLKVSEYNKRFGDNNIYFASRNFVDWATPETLGRYVVNGIVTAGASVYPQIMASARERAKNELPLLSQWLQAKGVDQAESVAANLLTGQPSRWPHLQFDMISVRYGSREKPLDIAKTPWRYVDHMAFVIIWKNGQAQARVTNEVAPTSNPSETGETNFSVHFAGHLGVSYQFIKLQDGSLGARIEKQPENGVPATRILIEGVGYLSLEPGDIIHNLDGLPFKSPSDVLGHTQQTTIRFQDSRTSKVMDGQLFIP